MYQDFLMPKLTVEIPSELAERLSGMEERLPELLNLSLQQPPLPSQIYRYILDFIASNPTPEEIAAFGPTPEMKNRLKQLLDRNLAGDLTSWEQQELAEYERIEHFVAMLKTGNIHYLNPSQSQ